MAETAVFLMDLDGSMAYQTINRVANYAQKRFSTIGGRDPFASLNNSAANFNKTLSHTNDRIIAFAASTSIIFGLANAFKSLYSSSIQVEKAMANIQVNIRATSTELNKLEKDLFAAASSTGQSFYVAAESAAEFARQGLKANQIVSAVTASLVLQQTTGMDAAASVQTLTAVTNTFTDSGLKYAEIVNKMAAADTSFAVSSKDLAEGVRRVGSTAVDANVSFDELLATITAIQQKTSRGGGVIGNALKSIFTRLQRDKTSETVENVTGIKTKNEDGSFRNQIEVLKDLAKQYDHLADSQKAQISELVGGVYQINIVKSIFQDLGKETSIYSQALDRVKNAQNDAFVKSSFLSSTNVSTIQKAKNEAIALGSALGKLGVNSASKGIIGDFADIGSALNNALTPQDTQGIAEKFTQAAVTGLVQAISGPGLAILVKGLSQLSGKLLGRFTADAGGTLYGSNKGASRVEMLKQQNALFIEAIKNEQKGASITLAVNQELLQRLSILKQINAVQSQTNTTTGRAANTSAIIPPSTPKFGTNFGTGPFSGRSNSQLSNLYANGSSSIQKSGAFNTLQGRLPALVKDLKSDTFIKSEGAKKVLQQIGAFNDPANINKGIPMNYFSDPALRSIMGKGGIQGTGASNVLKQRSVEFLNNSFQKAQESNYLKKQIQFEDASRFKNVSQQNSASSALARIQRDNAFLSKVENGRLGNRAIDNLATNMRISGPTVAQAKDLAKQDKSDRRRALSGKIDKYAFGASMALGAVAANSDPNSGIGVVSSIGSSAATGAVLGSSFGPVGAGIGATIGALKGMADVAKGSAIPLTKFAKEIENLGSTSEKQQNAIAGFLQSQERISNLIKNPNATGAEIADAVGARANALSDLPANLRSQLLGASDEKSKNSALESAQEFVAGQNKKTGAATALGSLMGEADKSNSSIGLFFRDLFNSKGESKLKFDNKEVTAQAIQSLVSNIDTKKLEGIAQNGDYQEKSDAANALEALNNGDLKSFGKYVKSLGVVSDETAKKMQSFLGKVDGPELDLFKATVIEAAQANKTNAKETQALIERTKSATSAFADFKKFGDSLDRREKITSTINGINADVSKSRLDAVSKLPGASEGTKTLLAGSQQFVDLIGQRKDLNSSTTSDTYGLLQSVLSEIGSSKISKGVSPDFIPMMMAQLKDNPDEIGATLNKLTQGISKLSVSKDIVAKLNEVNDSYNEKNAKIIANTNNLLNIQKTLEKIEKKQKFDELLDALINGDASQNALTDEAFQDNKSSFFNPTRKDLKDRQITAAVAERTGNYQPVADLISQRGDMAKEILGQNEDRKKRGLNTISASEEKSLKEAALKQAIVEGFNIQAQDRIGETGNSATGSFTRKVIKDAQNEIIRGGGSAGSLAAAKKMLDSGASQLTNPEDKNRDRLNGLSGDLQGRLESFQGATSNPIRVRLEKLIADLLQTKKPEDRDLAAKALAGNQLLDKGKEKEGLALLDGNPQTKSIADTYRREKGSLQGNINGALNDNAASSTETLSEYEARKALSGSSSDPLLIKSQSDLKASLDVLDLTVKSLNDRLSLEGTISAKSAGISRLSDDKYEKEKQLNTVRTEKEAMGTVSADSRTKFASDVPKILEKIKGYQGVFKNANDGGYGSDLELVRKSLQYGGRYDSLDKENAAFNNVGGLFQNNSTDKAAFENVVAVRKAAYNDEGKQKYDVQIESLQAAITQLTEQIRKKGEDLDSTRADGEKKLNEQKESAPQGDKNEQTFNLNLQGIDESLAEKLRPVFTQWIFDKIQDNKSNPAAFDAFGRGQTGIA